MEIKLELKNEDVQRWLFEHTGAYSFEWMKSLELSYNGSEKIAKVEYLDQKDKMIKRRIGKLGWAKGLAIMATKFPERFAQMMKGDDDNETFDLVWQCIIFGDEVYA